MTLDLLKTSGSAVTIKSEVDLASARTSIQDFVTTYNDVMKSLENLENLIKLMTKKMAYLQVIHY